MKESIRGLGSVKVCVCVCVYGEQVKRAIVEIAREVCSSVRRNSKRVWWNDDLKAVVKRKQVLGARHEAAKERCMEAYREQKRKDKEVNTYITAKRR